MVFSFLGVTTIRTEERYNKCILASPLVVQCEKFRSRSRETWQLPKLDLGTYYCACDKKKRKQTPFNCDRTHELSRTTQLLKQEGKKKGTVLLRSIANSSDHTATFGGVVHTV